LEDRTDDFARAYEECVNQVYGFFAYRLRSREEAEDLSQLTFERALRAWGRYDPRRASPSTWLLAIARNVHIDHHRHRSRRPEASLEDLDEARMPRTEIPETSLGLEANLAHALSLLGDRPRELIALRYGADLTGPEIAELTGLSLANVQQILSRSLRTLRAALDSDQQRGDEEQRSAGRSGQPDQRP
jgi:RNA polymerase sigma factor (sigma-70 family)